MTITVVDTEAVARAWAHTDATITAAIGQETWFGNPQAYEDPAKRPKAWASLSLVSETHEPSDMQLQQAILQFDVRGKTKLLASAATRAIQQAAQNLLLLAAPVTVAGAVIQVGSVSQVRWRPDTVLNLPRYQIDIRLLIRGL